MNQLSNLKEVWRERVLVDSIIAISLLQWLVMRYSIYNLEIIQAAVKMAKQERVFVSLDMASFEVYSFTTSDLSYVHLRLTFSLEEAAILF